jgi:hypothetical protein
MARHQDDTHELCARIRAEVGQLDDATRAELDQRRPGWYHPPTLVDLLIAATSNHPELREALAYWREAMDIMEAQG